MWRVSRNNSIIRWQGYRVSPSRLAESNFRYTQLPGTGESFSEIAAWSTCRRTHGNCDHARKRIETIEAPGLPAIAPQNAKIGFESIWVTSDKSFSQKQPRASAAFARMITTFTKPGDLFLTGVSNGLRRSSLRDRSDASARPQHCFLLSCKVMPLFAHLPNSISRASFFDHPLFTSSMRMAYDTNVTP
jgi:hypothetical protein